MSLPTYSPRSASGRGAQTPPTGPNPSHFLHISHSKLANLEYSLTYPVSTLPPPRYAPNPKYLQAPPPSPKDSSELLRRSLIIHLAVVRAEDEVKERREREEREMAFGGGMLDVSFGYSYGMNRTRSGQGRKRGSATPGGSRQSETKESIVEVPEEEESDFEDDGIPSVSVHHLPTPPAHVHPSDTMSTSSAAHIDSIREEAWFERTWAELQADVEADAVEVRMEVVEPVWDVEELELGYEVERVEVALVAMPSTILDVATPLEGTSLNLDLEADIPFLPLLSTTHLSRPPINTNNNTKSSQSTVSLSSSEMTVPSKPVLRPTLVKDKFYVGIAAQVALVVQDQVDDVAVVEVEPELESDSDVDGEDEEDDEECVTPTQDILDDFASTPSLKGHSFGSPPSDDFDHHEQGFETRAADGIGGTVKSTAQRSTIWREVFDAGEECGEW